MPNKKALAIAKQLILHNIGTIKDLPREVANTIANIYYKYSLPISQGELPTSSSSSDLQDGDTLQAMEAMLEQIAYFTTALETIPKMVSCIRDLDPIQQPNAFRDATDFFLDIYKYNIPNTHLKTWLRRRIERKFKKTDEIPGLIDLMDI